MKKFKQLFIITLCLAMTLIPVPSNGEDTVSTYGHFIEGRYPN